MAKGFRELEGQISVLDKTEDVDLTTKLIHICKSMPIQGLTLESYDPIIVFFKDVDTDFMKTIELIIGVCVWEKF